MGCCLVRLCNYIGGTEIVSYLIGRYKFILPNYQAFKPQLLFKLKIFVRTAVELSGHKQTYIQMTQTAVRISLKQQIKPFIITYKTEEQYIAVFWIKSKMSYRLFNSGLGAKVVIKRVRTECARTGLVKNAYITKH